MSTTIAIQADVAEFCSMTSLSVIEGLEMRGAVWTGRGESHLAGAAIATSPNPLCGFGAEVRQRPYAAAAVSAAGSLHRGITGTTRSTGKTFQNDQIHTGFRSCRHPV